MSKPCKFKRISVVLLFFFLCSSNQFAQFNPCGAVNIHPSLLTEYAYNPTNHSFNSTYIIPVVFHVFYDSTINNQPTLTSAEIDSVLLQTNRIINLQTADSAFVIPNFQSIIGNLSIEFRRASIDTNGNCFSGIVYHNLINGLLGPGSTYQNYSYDPNHYLNVNINQAVNGFSSGAYAYFPAPFSNPANQYDGIVYKSSAYFDKKTMVHEIGHYVGLLHTFGLANDVYGPCGDDFVSDTPPTSGSPYNCDTARMVCTPGLIENVQNHMDYSDDNCRIMFTDGQVSRSHGILNDTAFNRRDIWKMPNLIATGVDTIHTCNMFAGEIIYQPAGLQSCSVPSVYGFVLWSKYDNPDSVFWTTSEGVVSNPTNEEVSIDFATSGSKTITLTCYYNGVSYVYTKNIIVNQASTNGLYLTSTYPHKENFENGFSLPNFNLKVLNNTGSPWQLHSGHGYSSDSCLFIPTEAGVGIDTNTIVLGTFNMLDLHHPQLSFKIATSKASNVIHRKLIVRGKSLCSGDVFLYKFDYDSLFALNNTTPNFFPTNNAQWKTINILLDPYFYNGYGRRDMEFSIQLVKYFQAGLVDENVFIDQINLSDTVATAPPVAGLTVSNYNYCGAAPVLEFSEQCTNVPDSVKWFFNGFPLFGNPTAFLNSLPPIPDTSTITLIAYNSFGVDSITKLVIHRQIYWTGITATPNPICQGDTSTLHASFINAENFVWQNITSFNPNLYILSNNDSIIEVNPNTTTTFKVTATNTYGCSAINTVQVNVTPLPYVSITAPNCVPVGSVVQLSTPPGPSFIFNWTPAVGLNQTDSNVVIATIDSNITYAVTVTNNGCSYTQTATIFASSPANNVSLTITDSTLCTNQGTMIYANAPVGTSLLWGMNPCCAGTFTIMNDSAYADPFFNNTSYFVIATDPNGCVSSDTVHTTISPNPTFYTYPFEYGMGFSSIRLCVNEDSVALYTVDNDNLTYQWSTSGGAYFTNIQNGKAHFHIPGPAGAFYPVNVIGTNASGCSTTNPYLIEKYWGSTEPIYTISPSSPTICEGQSASVTLSPGGNYYYYYWVDTTDISGIVPLTYSGFMTNMGNGNTANISPDVPTHYTYIVYDYYTNCAKTRDYFVNVIPSPDLVVTVSDSSFCSGDTSIIQVSGAASYVWSPGSNMILSGGNTTATVFPTSSQTYTVQGTAGTCTSSASIPITVFTHPTVVANASDVNLCAGDSVVLYGTGAVLYSWNNSVVDNQYFSPASSNNYIVNGQDVNGCADSDSILVSVTNIPNVYLGNDTIICDSATITLDAGNLGSAYFWYDATATQQYVFPPSSPGSYNVWVQVDNNGCINTDSIQITVQNCSSSIHEFEGLTVNIYPNPASNVFYIQSSQEIDGIDIFDMLGRKVLTGTVQSNKVDISALSVGAYTVVLHSFKDSITKRIIISR